jgi:hypothetical protein
MESSEQAEPVNDLDNFFRISFDGASQEQLKQIALWAKICSITGLLGYLIQLYQWLFGHSLLVLGSGALGIVLRLVTIGGGGVVNYFLFRFAVAVSRGVQNMDALHVNNGFNSLRLYFRTAGILVIGFICLVVLALIGGLLSGLNNQGFTG